MHRLLKDKAICLSEEGASEKDFFWKGFLIAGALVSKAEPLTFWHSQFLTTDFLTDAKLFRLIYFQHDILVDHINLTRWDAEGSVGNTN